LDIIRKIGDAYGRRVLPRIIDCAMRHDEATRLRAASVPRANGSVLEVGIGSGLNMPFYTNAVTHLYGVDPSQELLAMARGRAASARYPVELLRGDAERVPLATASVDTVVTTWSLCSIANPAAALAEIRRLLKPDGAFIFVEHGLSPDDGVRKWQNRLTPLWRRVAGGCHLNRPVAEMIRDAGFAIVDLRTGYVPGPRPMTFMYEGIAHAHHPTRA
jgi:ubiquinone/menaquinone biosynthesis C-methylase UbiE